MTGTDWLVVVIVGTALIVGIVIVIYRRGSLPDSVFEPKRMDEDDQPRKGDIAFLDTPFEGEKGMKDIPVMVRGWVPPFTPRVRPTKEFLSPRDIKRLGLGGRLPTSSLNTIRCPKCRATLLHPDFQTDSTGVPPIRKNQRVHCRTCGKVFRV